MTHDIVIRRVEPAFSDERGSITDVVNTEDGIGHIGIITFAEGAVRANHYHPRSIQRDYVLAGRIELRTKPVDPPDAPVRTDVIEAGYFVEIPTNVVHAYKALEPSTMLDMTTLSRSGSGYEDDTVRVPALF